jgi:hypothetical protein
LSSTALLFREFFPSFSLIACWLLMFRVQSTHDLTCYALIGNR